MQSSSAIIDTTTNNLILKQFYLQNLILNHFHCSSIDPIRGRLSAERPLVLLIKTKSYQDYAQSVLLTLLASASSLSSWEGENHHLEVERDLARAS